MKKIMVLRLSAMGDVAMTVPVLQALHQAHPDLDIIMVSKPFFEPLFKDLPKVTFIGVDVKNQYKGIFGLYRLYRFLKQQQPNAIADLHEVLRTKIIDLFFKLNSYNVAVINKGRQEKRALTRPKNKIFKPLKTTYERYADVFRKLGFNLDLKKTNTLKPALSGQTGLFLQTFEGQTLIGIAPFAAHKGKQYPLDKIKEVIRKLLAADSQINILLFGGGAKEKALLNDLEKTDRNRVVNLAGIFDFENELELISRLNLMVSMDSGNGHLAALFGVPVVSIWGATHPYAGFAPFNQPEDWQIIPDLQKFPQLPTSIYGNKTFEDFEQIWETITPASIVKKIIDILSSKN